MQTDLHSFLQAADQFQTIPVIQSFYSDTITPIHALLMLENEVSYFLESHDQTSPWANYSFIGLNPFMTLREKEGMFLLVDHENDASQSFPTFLKAYEKMTCDLSVMPKPSDLEVPFYGGAVGYIAYDAALMESSIIETYHLPYPAYLFQVCKTMISYNHHDKSFTFTVFTRITPNESKQTKIEKYDCAIAEINRMIKKIECKETTYPSILPMPTINSRINHVPESNYPKEQYMQDVVKVKQYIKQGDIFQGVLSQRFEIETTCSGKEIYRLLRQVNPSPYLFYLNDDHFEIIGSSPEKLVEVHDHHLEIHPIAGTRPRGETADEDAALELELKADKKERAEHLMLVDLARNDLGRVSVYGSVSVPFQMEVVRFSHVMHMISKVTGTLRKDVHPIEALMYAFPAGTVSGTPKKRAMEILHELEPTPRGIYAGTIAYIDFSGNIDSCIAIRTMVVKNNKAYIQAGGGIVTDSDPEKEWNESLNKAKALIKTVEMANVTFAKKGSV